MAADSDAESLTETVAMSSTEWLGRLLDHEQRFTRKLRTLTNLAQTVTEDSAKATRALGGGESFNLKLQTLTDLIFDVADDHAKAMKQLKSAYRQHRTMSDTKPSREATFDRKSLEQDRRSAQQPDGSEFKRQSATIVTRSRLTPAEGFVSPSGDPAPTVEGVRPSSNHSANQKLSATPVQRHDHEGRWQSKGPVLVDYSSEESADDTDEDGFNEDSMADVDAFQDTNSSFDGINHETLLGEQNDTSTLKDTPSKEAPSRKAPSREAPSTHPTSKKAKPKIKKTPSSDRRAGAKWTEEEEDLMISILHKLKDEDFPTRTDMWQRASALMGRSGYDRRWETMAAKWSLQTRQTCAKRGLAWAQDVMKRMPHIPRKKRQLFSSDGATPNDSSKKRWTKRPKKKSKQGPEADGARRVVIQPHGHQSDLQLRHTFTDASAAIVQVDWSPDGKFFAAASNSIMDEEDNFAENKPGNLIHGSLITKTIRELPEHRQEGKKKHIYTTVSAVKFGRTGQRMYTGGFDCKVRVWDVENEGQIDCKTEFRYLSKRVEVLDVTGETRTILATGTSSGSKSIRVFIGESSSLTDPLQMWPLKETGISVPGYDPTCLKFGKVRSENMLLAGFGGDVNSPGQPFGGGCLAVWQFTESKCEALTFNQPDHKFVSDAVWTASGDSFVVGINGSDGKEAEEHSVVKLYSTRSQPPTTKFSCGAIDINEVTSKSWLVTASCTDGSTYVWDQRNPKEPVHALTHGQPVTDYGTDRERNDVGVRYVEWTNKPGQLYTGGSDGLLKLWDTNRSAADSLVQNVADVGYEILCGKLSPDQTSLLIGDENGQLHLFGRSNGPLAKENFAFRLGERWASAEEATQIL